MTKLYFKSEYTEKQWQILIDNAIKVGCTYKYSKYGDIVLIDSTDAEIRLSQGDEISKKYWADHIHNIILNEEVKKERRI